MKPSISFSSSSLVCGHAVWELRHTAPHSPGEDGDGAFSAVDDINIFLVWKGLDLSGDNETRGIKAKTVLIWVCRHGAERRIVPHVSRSPPSRPPKLAFHHHWSVPSINGQVCPQSISISLPLPHPPLHFFTLPPCAGPPSSSPLTPVPHTLRSQGSLPPRWFVNSSLRRNQYYINKPQRAFCTYPVWSLW